MSLKELADYQADMFTTCLLYTSRWCTDFEGLEDGRHLRLAVKDESSNRRLIETLQEALEKG